MPQTSFLGAAYFVTLEGGNHAGGKIKAIDVCCERRHVAGIVQTLC